MSTCNSEVSNDWEDGELIKDYLIEMRTLTSILDEYYNNGDIHFLKIDVEGFEKETLEGIDFSKYRPWIIVIESTKPNSQEPNHDQWEKIVLDNNYIFVYFDGLNRFYLDMKFKDNKDILNIPPNFFDKFVRYSEIVAYRKVELANTEAEKARTEAEKAQAAVIVLRQSWSFRLGFYILHPWQLVKYLLDKIRR